MMRLEHKGTKVKIARISPALKLEVEMAGE